MTNDISKFAAVKRSVDSRTSGGESLVLVAEDLRMFYGPRLALRGLSFSLRAGRILGFLGPNGAGKTTAIRILTTILDPSAGQFTIDGIKSDNPQAIRRRIGVLPESLGFHKHMTGEECLVYFGRLFGRPAGTARDVAHTLLKEMGLDARGRSLIGSYSRGMRQRLGIARALVNEPAVLFLDEPTLGLDPDVSIRLRAQIAALRRERGTTIILTTHYMREAEELCDEIAFIKAGRILAQGTADELKRQIRIGDVISLRLDPAVPQGLTELPGILQAHARGEHIDITVDAVDKRLPEILRWLHDQSVLVRNCQVHDPELEEVFVELAR
jgi:ABC-2 type transport system ATP-binding protein